jgi:hypothetical protein
MPATQKSQTDTDVLQQELVALSLQQTAIAVRQTAIRDLWNVIAGDIFHPAIAMHNLQPVSANWLWNKDGKSGSTRQYQMRPKAGILVVVVLSLTDEGTIGIISGRFKLQPKNNETFHEKSLGPFPADVYDIDFVSDLLAQFFKEATQNRSVSETNTVATAFGVRPAAVDA